MSEQKDNSQERTEEPTPKRLREAREKGQVPRSKELSAMLVTLTGAVTLLLFGGHFVGNVAGILEEGLSHSREVVYDTNNLPNVFRAAVAEGLSTVAPIMVVCIIAALAAPSLIGGWSFSLQSMQPKLSKLNPISGLGRIFGARGGMELLKAIGKVFAVALVAGLLFWSQAEQYLSLGDAAMPQAIFDAGNLIAFCFTILAMSLILIALVDVPFQLWDHNRKLKMTRQEVKDENKETEGKPEVKQKVRETQQEMSRRRMMEDVPKADVVVTNPTHVSVALQYDARDMDAPKVIAKGQGYVALRIREIAHDHEIPLLEAPPLARALDATTDIGKEIPARLYMAVAQVLTWVFQLRRQQTRGGPRPKAPNPEVSPDDDPDVRGRG